MYPGDYLRHLMKVMGTIARHGRAVVVGRGANFILPADKQFSVRVICPQEERVKNVARTFDVSLEAARHRVIRRESRRRAFVRQSFNADISDPLHYDMVLNTGRTGESPIRLQTLTGVADSLRNHFPDQFDQVSLHT
jgi:cytidylate kinase